MDISPTVTSYTPEDNSWIASAHGTDATETVTIDGSVGFIPATHFPTGVLKSGTPLAKVTASGKYALYDNAAADGRTAFVGFLVGDVAISATKSVGAAILTHGKVKESRLPFPVDAAGKADAPLIRFV